MAKFASFRNREDMSSAARDAKEARLNSVQNTDPANDPAVAPTVGSDAEPDQEGVTARVPTADATVTQTVAQADYDAVVQDRDELKDKLARQQAEFANATRRQTKERAELRDLIVGNTVDPFLPVLDNFHLALKAQGTPEQFRAGVELIARQLDEALKSLGIVAVETVGAAFDPHVHEALGQVETSEAPDHQVMDELRRGYKLKDRLLRPAQVRVASNQALTTSVN